MKNYYDCKSIKNAATLFARENGRNKATKIIPIPGEFPEILKSVDFGYRKCTTGEYVPNKYLNNFGWKNTYYQWAVCEVGIPEHWYLWFGWRI